MRAVTLCDADPVRWREVVLLMAGQLANSKQKFMVWRLLEALVYGPPDAGAAPDDPRLARALYAGLAVQESALWKPDTPQDKTKLENIRLWLKEIVAHGHLDPVDRAAAGRVLGALGDDRPGVCDLNIQWVTVPAGEFLMGSTEEQVARAEREAEEAGYSPLYKDELPQHEVVLPAYKISKYPVTNAQY
ncbi:MAG: SUMF1/EgtB/PvdO family nonheme iron enzyme [Anaerolineae bacterium]|nr:SUMF1/EgtB/PvdO family nonheme iron enzyme [Anaerolineae bacterium]